MITVYYSNSEGSSQGRDFPNLSEALSFVETDARENRSTLRENRATVTESDGVFVIRRMKFIDGDLVKYEVNRGFMVNAIGEDR